MCRVPTSPTSRDDRLLPAGSDDVRMSPVTCTNRVAGCAGHLHRTGMFLPQLLAEDQPFSDPATLFVSSDHYVTRQLHACGVPLDALSVAHGANPREVWRTLAGHSHALAGTASAFWLRDELASVFGIEHDLTPGNADEVFDRISELLRQPEFRPRALFHRFGIQVLATTDDPLDSLDAHQALSDSATFAGRVVPTLRADAYIDPAATNFRVNAERLLTAAGAPATFAGYLGALQERRAYFIERGAVSVDVGVIDPATAELTAPRPRACSSGRSRALSAEDQRVFRAPHAPCRLVRMSVEDGLVLTIHAGVYRNHSTATFEQFARRTKPATTSPFAQDSSRELEAAAGEVLAPLSRTSTSSCSRLTRQRSRASLPPSRASTRVSTSGLRGGFLTPRTQSFAGVQRSPKRRASTVLPASSTTPAPSSPYLPGTTCRGAPTHPSWPAMWWRGASRWLWPSASSPT